MTCLNPHLLDEEHAILGAAMVVLHRSLGRPCTHAEAFDLIARTLGAVAMLAGAPSVDHALEAANEAISRRMEEVLL